jgi:hypothetical protein
MDDGEGKRKVRRGEAEVMRMTPTKRWPNDMADFRNISAEIALEGDKKLKKLLASGMHDKIELQAVAEARSCFQDITLNMALAGAPIRSTVLSNVTR